MRSVKTYLILLVVGFFLASCASPRVRLAKLLRNHPDLLDTLEVVRVDTLYIPAGLDTAKLAFQGDTLTVDGMLTIWSDSIAGTGIVQPEGNLPGRREESARNVRAFRRVLIRTINPDTIFRIKQTVPIHFKDTVIQWSKEMTFQFQGGKLYFKAVTDPLKVPFEYRRTELRFDPVPVYKRPWLWALIVSVILNILFIIKALRR